MSHITRLGASVCAFMMLFACGDEPPHVTINQGCFRAPASEDGTYIICNQGDGDYTDNSINGGEGGNGGGGGEGSAASSEKPQCLSQEGKCTTADNAPGWCVSKYWSNTGNNALVCLACDDPYLSLGCPVGCTPTGNVCQWPDGQVETSLHCGPGCCPICY